MALRLLPRPRARTGSSAVRARLVLVDQQRSALVRHDDIERAGVPQIRQRDGAAVIGVGGAHRLRDVGEVAEAVVDPDALALIAGEAAALHRRPVGSVADDRAVPDGNHGEVVPVAAALPGRDVSVDQIDILRAVVVQIAELRSPTPAARSTPIAVAMFSNSGRPDPPAWAPRDRCPAPAGPARRCSSCRSRAGRR